MKKFEVKIHVKTSLTGPSVKDGSYAAIVEYAGKDGPVTREITGKEENTTYYRSVLLAILKSLEILRVGCSVIIYTDCNFVKSTIEQNRLEAWRRLEWTKPSGGEVKNKELWQQFLEEMDKHEIEVRFNKNHVLSGYGDRLTALLGG